jgi:poly(3-hydroxybutyrate) depolymerase
MKALRISLLVLLGAGIVAGLAFLALKAVPTRHRSADESGSSSNSAPINNPEAASGKQTFHLQEDGVNREFIVYRPGNLDTNDEVPVVFMFHGSGQNGEMFYENSGWKEKADAEGFMVVFPTGLKYHVFSEEKVIHGSVEQDVARYQTKWNTLDLGKQLDPAYPDQELADDVQFTRDMLAFVEENYAVDSSRVYASGFSNGSGFVNRLVLEASDIFAAFGSGSSGTVTVEALEQSGFTPGPNFTPRPLMRMIGSDDPKITFAAGVNAFPTDESAMDDGSIVRTILVDGALQLLGLSDTYTFEQQGKVSSYDFSQPAVGSDSEAEYDLLIVDGMKHVYPNGDNFPVVAVDIYWSFFEQYSL